MTVSAPTIGILPVACSRFKGMGKETPKTYEQRIGERLDGMVQRVEEFSTVVNVGPMYTREDIKTAMDTFHHNSIDCVFVVFLSWSEDFHWIRFLRDMYPTPLFFAHVVVDISYGNTEQEDPFIEYLSTGGLVGALEGSGSIARFNNPMTYSCCGTLEDIVTQLRPFAEASAVRSRLMQSNFGLLNNYNEVMWSTYVDPYLLFSKMGPELRFVSVPTLEAAADAIDDERVAKNIQVLLDKYESRDDVVMEHFKASMRCSLAVEDVARTLGVDMMVLNDVGATLYERMGLRPGFYPTPENDNDVAVVPEGDIGLGLAVYIMKLLSKESVNSIEPAYIDNDGSLMVVHAGPNDYSDPRGKTIIARDIRFARSKWKHAGAPFAWHVIFPGEKTMVHVSQDREQGFKMVATTALALEHEHSLASYTHGKLSFPNKETKQVMDALIKEGVTQHYALAPGNHLSSLRHLAHILGIRYVEI